MSAWVAQRAVLIGRSFLVYAALSLILLCMKHYMSRLHERRGATQPALATLPGS